MNRELVFTAFNRPGYLQETIASWNEARRLDQWNAKFFIEPSPLQVHTTTAANELRTTVSVQINETRQGVLVNPWNAINDAFSRDVDFVVLAEDDVLVSSDVLEYFEWASETFARDTSILVVNSFSTVGGSQENKTFVDDVFSPLVWGMWRGSWESYLRDTWDKDYSSGKPDGSEAGWDWNINRILKANSMKVLKPVQSRSDHIGEFGGTHMTPDLFDSSRGADFKLARGRQLYFL
jgi:hypothetical protein